MNKKRRIKPRADVTRSQEVKPVSILDIPMEMVSIREWHPDAEGKLPAEQVHLVITLEDETELGLRFCSPDTLGFLIEELIAYRKQVWVDAEPINPDATLKVLAKE
jgi:hypothetical protein